MKDLFGCEIIQDLIRESSVVSAEHPVEVDPFEITQVATHDSRLTIHDFSSGGLQRPS